MKNFHLKSVAVAVLVFGFSFSASVYAEPLKIGVEPIIGYEHVQKILPTAHSKNRLIYGARLTAGILLISAEAEYTHGTDTEDYPDQLLITKDTDEMVKIGLRSGFNMGSLLSLIGRGGVQAKRNFHEDVTNGVSSSIVSPITYKPYAGADFRANLSNKFSATAGVVVVFNDINDMNQNEYQTTAGFEIRLP